MSNHVQTVSQCKVCMSKLRNHIEQLHLNGLSPEKIYNYLQGLTKPEEKTIVISEDIKPSSIRRHIQRHFNSEEGAKVKLAETKARVDQSRSMLNQGVQIAIDRVNSLNHLIEVAMIKMEEIEHSSNDSKKHQFTIQYMNTIKGLVESVSKLTGDLKQEGHIDINFFNNEIATFADIVISTIRIVDKKLSLMGELEKEFVQEFAKQWQDYQERQTRVVAGELVHNTVNTFNEIN